MIKKRFIVFLFCATMIMGNALNVTAADINQNTYEQEYFQWKGGSGLDSSIASIKDFTFEIFDNVESKPFKINKSSVNISSYANVMDMKTNKIVNKYDGKKYKIELRSTKLFGKIKSATFTVGSDENKTITGLDSGNYTLRVINTSMDLKPTSYRLVGGGYVN